MFLKELNKNESIAFINLVKLLANVDEVFAKNEKDLIKDYIEELSLTNEPIKNLSFELAVKELEGSADRIKNIIYFELVGLALSDGSYDEKEVSFLNDISSNFCISKKNQQNFIDYFKKVKDAYNTTFIDYKSKIDSLKKLAENLL